MLAPFRRRTVRMGIRATLLIAAGLAVIPFLPGEPITHPTIYWVLLGTTIVGTGVVAALPWDRLLLEPAGEVLLYAWSVLDIALISGFVAITGGGDTPFLLIYTLTTVFFAASYPRRGQYGLFALTAIAYLVAASIGADGVLVADAAVVVATLGVAAYMTGFVSRQLLTQVAESYAARQEADHRAELLARAGEAARTISSLDPDEVLDAVVDAAAGLGFEAANIDLFDEMEQTYQVVHPRGLPDDYVDDAVYAADHGMPGLVREERATITVDDYSRYDKAIPILVESGFRAVIAAPVWAQGRLAAVLVAGTRRARRIAPSEVEAFDLLAAQAGRALENAAQFTSELRTIERLAELDRLKSDFVANASHELRTPLTVISGLAQTMDDRWDHLDDAQRRKLFERVRANARALEDIVGTLLDFSRLERGRSEADQRTFDVADLVRRVVDRVRPVGESHHLEVTTAETLRVEADPVLLERVIENLIVNAFTHTPAGTRVQVQAVEEDGMARIAVSDDGPGVDSVEQGHLGERFFRGGDVHTRPTRGLGLGLAMASEILQMHRSSLEIDSVLGEGSTFGFRLPLTDREAAGPVRSARERSSTRSGDAG